MRIAILLGFTVLLSLTVAKSEIYYYYDSDESMELDPSSIKDFTAEIHPLSDEMIEHINSIQSTWKAGRNFDSSIDMGYIRKLMGVLPEAKHHKLPQRKHQVEGLYIPREFDSRIKWPYCPSLKEVRDQGSCGSCWAIAATEAMTDRYCIATKGKKHFRFSAENLVSCCRKCGQGCNGGIHSVAWEYWVNVGIVSGGPFDSHQGCQPYVFAPCEHHMNGSRPNCTRERSTPECLKTCESNYSVPYKQDLCFGKKAYSLQLDQTQIQIDILKSGPVEGAISIYPDFLLYKSGVYHHVVGDEVGRHAVKILGWGQENSTPYWLVANSWNYDWGERGFFKIKRGSNECGIEDSISSGLPKI